MGPTPTCPDPRELQRLGHGELSEEEAEKLSEHILTSSTCADRLDAVCADDPIAASLRRGVSPLLADNPTADALIERLARRPPETALAATQSDSSADTPGATVTMAYEPKRRERYILSRLHAKGG